MSAQSRNRWRAVALVIVLCAAALAILQSVRPATIQLHRLMYRAAFAARVKLDGPGVPSYLRTFFQNQADWHQHRLVSMGHLNRRDYNYRAMTYPSPAGAAMFRELRAAMGRDCQSAIGEHHITIWAPPHSIDRLMTIMKSHDVVPVGDTSREATTE